MGVPRPIRRRVAPADGGVPQTFDGEVTANVDDGYSKSNEFFTRFGGIAVCGKHATDGHVYDTFARFTNVTIAAGATIDSAYITVMNDRAGPGATTTTKIFFEDSDDAVAPALWSQHNADVRTAASTQWDDVNFSADTATNSPDISAVIQEIVDRGGWSSGNAMMLLWDDDGGTDAGKWYTPYMEDDATGDPIKLHVEFTA